MEKYNKIILTDELKNKINNILESHKKDAQNNVTEYSSFEDEMDLITWEDFYNIIMDEAEKLNPHIDWNNAEQSLFNMVAQDREKLWDDIVKNNFVL